MSALLGALLCAGAARGEELSFDIPAQSLRTAIQAFAQQAGLQILASAAVVGEQRSNGVRGRLEVASALQELLAGSNLEITQLDRHTVTLVARLPEPPAIAAAPSRRAQAPTAPAALEEVVVTAQRRPERLLDVPVSMTVFVPPSLEYRNVENVGGIAGFAPNVKIYQGIYSTGVTVGMRGGVEINPAPYYDPTVGIYVDGVYIGKAQGALFDLADIDRIEVLRGPQGTLYGRNTFAGAINITTAPPTGRFGGTAKLGFGNYAGRRARLNLDLPAAGKISVKLSGLLDRHDGFARVVANPHANVAQAQPRNHDRLENANRRAARAAAHLAASDALTVDYAFDLSRAWETPRAPRLNYVAPAALGGFFDPASPSYVGGLSGGVYQGFPADLYLLPSYTDWVYATGGADNQPLFERLAISGHALTAAWQPGDVTLKSITAFRRMDFGNAFDLDATPLPLVSTFFDNRFRQSSQELQALGSAGAVSFTAGFYYYHEHGRTINFQQFFGNATTSDSRYRWANDAYAAYGQADFVPGLLDDRLTLTGGIRYSWERKYFSRGLASRNAAGAATLIADGTADRFVARAWTPTLIATLALSDAAIAYVKYARGFKGGGFNLGASQSTAVIRFAPEFVDSFEVGAKARLLDDSLQITAAGFLNKIRDAQVSVFQSSGTLTISVIDNAARATVRGFELEAALRPVDWLRLSGSIGYTVPRYDHYFSLGGDLRNDTAFVLVPKVMGSLSADATVASGRWGEWHVQFDYQHADRYYTLAFSKQPLGATVSQSAQPTRADQVDQLDMTVRLVDLPVAAGQALTVSAWAKNLLNQHARMGGTDFGPNLGHLANGLYTPPRTFGADVTIRF